MTANEIFSYIIPGAVTLAVTLIAGRLRARPRLVCWFPHEFFFNLVQEGVSLRTHSLTVQNVGRETAEDVEVIHNSRPDFISIHPPLQFEEETTPTGEHVLRIKSLGPSEHFFMQMLTYKSPTPALLNVRSRKGRAKPIPVQLQQVFPRWAIWIVVSFFLIGVWVIAYWLYRGIIFAGNLMGFW